MNVTLQSIYSDIYPSENISDIALQIDTKLNNQYKPKICINGKYLSHKNEYTLHINKLSDKRSIKFISTMKTLGLRHIAKRLYCKIMTIIN